MKNLAIFCAVVFGCAAMAGASQIGLVTPCPVGAAADSVSIAFTETRLSDVATLNGVQVDEIDINLASIGGTYLNGANVIPASTLINNIAGSFYFPGGACFLASTKANGNPAYATETLNPHFGAIGDIDYPGYFNAAHDTFTSFNFPSTPSAPLFNAIGTGMGAGTYVTEATQIVFGGYCSNSLYEIGTTQQNGHTTVGDGNFDNTLVASFYVTSSTKSVQFYTDDGNPWNVQNSTGGYSQMGFSYGGGRTSYVEIVAPTPEPATLALLASGLLGLLAYAWKKRR